MSTSDQTSEIKTILIADDDRDLVTALSCRMMHMGFRVTTAHDALTALVLIKRDTPDFVVLDIHMPAGNGMSVLEMIRSEPEWQHLPVIIISGGANPAMIDRVRSDGAHFVAKRAGMWPSVKQHIEACL